MLFYLAVIKSCSACVSYRGWKAAPTMIDEDLSVGPATVSAQAAAEDRPTSDLTSSRLESRSHHDMMKVWMCGSGFPAVQLPGLLAMSYELLCFDLFGFIFYIRFNVGDALFEVPDAFADPGTDLGELAGPEYDHP